MFAQQIGQIAQLFPQVIKGAIGLRGPLAAIAIVLTPIVTAFARLGTEANSLDLFTTAPFSSCAPTTPGELSSPPLPVS